jgi:hypothetical protein
MTIDTYAANEAMRLHAQATCGMTPPSTDGTVTEQVNTAFPHAESMFHKYVNRIDTSKFTPEGLQEVIAQFTGTDSGKGVDTAVDKARELRANAAARVEHLRRELSPPGDTATELRNTRFWDRAVRILDNISDSARLPAVADELIAKADRAQLGVLLAELGPYMQARVEGLPGLSQEQRRRLIEGYTKSIEAATDNVAPEYGKAKRQLSQAEKVFQITEFNAQSLRKLFTAAPGSYRPVLVDPRQYDPDR